MNQRSNAVGRFPLEVAERIAAAVVERLAPHAEKIVVAGSIRRRRPDVGDIDLVAIPKLEQVPRGLFTTETQQPQDSQLAVEFCSFRYDPPRFRGEEPDSERPPRPRTKVLQRGPKTISVQLALLDELAAGIRVDLYLCTAETWATTLLIRTGSAAHNIWLCTRARELGGKLHADGSGLELPGEYDPVLQRTVNMRRITPTSEMEIFHHLVGDEHLVGPIVAAAHGTTMDAGIPPELREIVHGKPAWLSHGDTETRRTS